MSSDEDAVRGRIMGLLMSPNVMKIDFTLGSVRVEHTGFLSVVKALLNGASGTKPGAIGINIGNVASDAAASYDNNKHAFMVVSAAYGATVTEQATIVHESVHAMRDIQGSGPYANAFKPGWPPSNRAPVAVFTNTEDEAAAYVAQMVHRLYAGDPPPGTSVDVFEKRLRASPGNRRYDIDISAKAYAIASSIMSVKGAVVPDKDVMSLRNIILGSQHYRERNIKLWEPSLANGLPEPIRWHPPTLRK